MQSFWDDVALMQAVGRVFTFAALLLLTIAMVGWVLQRPYFSINQFKFVGDVGLLDAKQTHDVIQNNLGQGLSGGFFSMNLRQVQSNLQQLSWVKNTTVRRVWPHQIEIRIETYQPIAVWKQRYLSQEGQIFDSTLSESERQKMVQATGPDEASALVAEQLPKLRQQLAALGWQMRKVELTQRYSWRVWMDNGLQIELGRMDTPNALEERVSRLIEVVGFVQENAKGGGYIDMRYPNGFAMKTTKLHRVGKQ